MSGANESSNNKAFLDKKESLKNLIDDDSSRGSTEMIQNDVDYDHLFTQPNQNDGINDIFLRSVSKSITASSQPKRRERGFHRIQKKKQNDGNITLFPCFITTHFCGFIKQRIKRSFNDSLILFFMSSRLQ